MEMIGALFEKKQDLSNAMRILEEKGFREFTLYGPEALFATPDKAGPAEDYLEQQMHRAMGSVSGITINRRPVGMSGPHADSIVDEMRDMGISQEDADRYVAGLQQNRTLLLLDVRDKRAEEAKQVMREQGAMLPTE